MSMARINRQQDLRYICYLFVGCYFGSYFVMGGERFDTTQPEAYLFGENQDLNFLGNRPVPVRLNQ